MCGRNGALDGGGGMGWRGETEGGLGLKFGVRTRCFQFEEMSSGFI